MNVDGAVSCSRVKRISNNVIHLVDIDSTVDYLVQVWLFLIRQFSNGQFTYDLGVQASGLKPLRYFSLVDKPGNKSSCLFPRYFERSGSKT